MTDRMRPPRRSSHTSYPLDLVSDLQPLQALPAPPRGLRLGPEQLLDLALRDTATVFPCFLMVFYKLRDLRT